MDKTKHASPAIELYPLRTAGFLMTPLAMSCLILNMDRDQSAIRPDTLSAINAGLFWTESRRFRCPGLTPDRATMALDWLQANYAVDLNEAPHFRGEIDYLCPKKVKSPDNGPTPWLSDNSTITWLSPRSEPSMFRAAYDSPDQLAREFQRTIGGAWPSAFPWMEHLVSIYGIYGG